MEIYLDNHLLITNKNDATILIKTDRGGKIGSVNLLTKYNNSNKKVPLGKIKCGNTVKIGDHEYIVLSHSKETTAVITKKSVKTMIFGTDSYYTKSTICLYCNGEFYHELCIINPDGVFNWSGCDCSHDVRPYCILNSSILV